MPSFIDPVDQSVYPLTEKIWRSPSGRPLMMTPMKGISRDQIIQGDRSIWRYREALPLMVQSPVSLGEGCTPLVEHMYRGHSCHWKLEWFSPTGSFKDRGASVMLSLLKQQGISTVIEDSSGNGGAAVAAYAAAAGMNSKVLVPASTQPSKIAQIRAYGAEVILVPGPREATENAAIDMASTHFYASHNWHPFFLQGTKTLGYELWEDLGFTVPDNIIIPASAGSNLLGCYIAFKELMASGETNRIPRLFVSQPANCAPLHDSFTQGANGYVQSEYKATVAEGTAIKRPIRLKEMLLALRESNGGTVVSAESEIIEAGLELARAGLYVEPTSAHAASAFSKLIENRVITENEVTIAILTGSGLKATSFYESQFEQNPP
ncbi:MAG: pyridoxal-phosphate dependent enzyme [Halioglobus sp.]